VYIFVDGVRYGPYDAQFLEGFQYQLDPCHTITFRIHFYFEEYDIDDNLLPQGQTMGFRYFIKWAQWNEVPGAPTPLP
jgi:hypothetical protein